MSHLRSRIQRLERRASKAGTTQKMKPEDISWLFEPYVPPPNPVDLMLEQAWKGNFISLEQAKAMIASGEVTSAGTESPPGC